MHKPAQKQMHSYATESMAQNQLIRCYLCEQQGHSVHSCRLLLSKQSVPEKKALLKEKGLCFSCFNHGHISRNCRKRLTCDVCQRKHPTILHVDFPQSNDADRDLNHLPKSEKKSSGQNALTKTDSVPLKSNSVCCASTEGNVVFHAILPVKLQALGRDLITYCFLDNGSDGCFISQELYDQLNLNGRDSVLQLSTMHGATYEHCSVVEGLTLTDCDRRNESDLTAKVVHTTEYSDVYFEPCATRS